jgi:hypothetical protein
MLSRSTAELRFHTIMASFFLDMLAHADSKLASLLRRSGSEPEKGRAKEEGKEGRRRKETFLCYF